MPASTDEPRLGPRFAEALVYAEALHRRQIRKGVDIPYVSHLMAVSAIVLEHGGSEDEAIGALLHDAVEDQGGVPTLEHIRQRFGSAVAEIVAGCSDSMVADDTMKPPWRERKVKYLDHFKDAPASVRLVSMADKLHNCRSTVADLHHDGPATWSKFNAAREDQLWFYRTFTELARTADPAFAKRPLITRLLAELERAVSDLERLA